MDLNGKTILITGGTGSFGTAFIGRAARATTTPHAVRVFSRDELKQSELQRRFARRRPRCASSSATCATASACARATRGVDVVVHAAALKQVPACEYNPFEAVQTNVIGAENVIEAAIDNDVPLHDRALDRQGRQPGQPLRRDQAVRREALRAGQRLRRRRRRALRLRPLRQRRRQPRQRHPALQAAGARRGELTITDERMTRFWITLDAGRRVRAQLRSSSMEGGEIFVPKIPSMRVVDLADGDRARRRAPTSIGIRPGREAARGAAHRGRGAARRFDARRPLRDPARVRRPGASSARSAATPLADGFRYASRHQRRAG